MARKEHRLVHLDLKGAPPKLLYYEQLFPLLRRWGATGLLVEYEDCFPYEGELRVLQAQYAYSKEDIDKLQALAAAHELEIIPLLQTFGHFEFVLKHDAFRELREIAAYPMALCPCHPRSLAVVREMVEQLVEAHPHIHFFHIGADEVYHLGVCDTCKAHMQEHGLDAAAMFFKHVRGVLEFVKSKYPHLTCIMWDDMFRLLDAERLKGSGLSGLVEPMVWYYQRSFDYLPADLWERYSAVFSHVWAASAFKGATGASMFVTDISFHLDNHCGWLQLEKSHMRPHFETFRGYCLTGWQRYDHYATLCEMLPVGLPSLAMCLLVLQHGGFTAEGHTQASTELGFKQLIPLNPHASVGVIAECDFPGSDVYVGATQLMKLKADYNAFIHDDRARNLILLPVVRRATVSEQLVARALYRLPVSSPAVLKEIIERLRGWMTAYHVRHNFTNPAHLHHFLPLGRQLLEALNRLCEEMSQSLSRIFFPDVAEEFISSEIRPHLDKVSDIVRTAEGQLVLKAGPKQDRSTAPVGMETP